MLPFPASIQRLAKRHQPLLIMLIGPPGAGKTTWRHNYVRQCNAPVPHVVSTDDVIEREAAQSGVSYDQAFNATDMTALMSTTLEDFARIVAHGCDTIIDRTNLTIGARQRWLGRCPSQYVRVAVVFEPDPYVLADRLVTRQSQTGKHVPVEVITDMIMSYEPPTEDEFDHILKAEDTW